MKHDCATRTVAGTALVTVRLRNEAAVPRRVRVRNELSGPVLPPRREGVPERGWSNEGFTGVVAANDERTLGYACPATADCETPVSVQSLGRADGREEEESTAERVAETVRSLGRARPPADAVPTPADAVPTSTDAVPTSAAEATSLSTRSPEDGSDPETTVPVDSTAGTGAAVESDTSVATATADFEAGAARDDVETVSDAPRSVDADGGSLPQSVESWLSAVEGRVERAERLTDATADEAAAVLESTGDVSGLPAAVAADEESLRAVAVRATALADRAAAADAEPVVNAVSDL